VEPVVRHPKHVDHVDAVACQPREDRVVEARSNPWIVGVEQDRDPGHAVVDDDARQHVHDGALLVLVLREVDARMEVLRPAERHQHH
jgi:hypothetical protein